jgi:hypothetical protein
MTAVLSTECFASLCGDQVAHYNIRYLRSAIQTILCYAVNSTIEYCRRDVPVNILLGNEHITIPYKIFWLNSDAIFYIPLPTFRSNSGLTLILNSLHMFCKNHLFLTVYNTQKELQN